MQDAETVLAVIRDRGERRLPLEELYRQLTNPALYLLAYGRIYRNQGAMTQGVTSETVDGMSLAKINQLIEEVKYERVRWSPVRRVYIPKKSGKTRPLGIPTWKDKLLQEVMRLLLEAYYEPQFSLTSHGFRPGRGCHTALTEVYKTWKGTKWFIEGDIKGCFDNIDHETLLSILGEQIHDNRFLRLTRNLLKAGYMEEWRYNPTYSGTPQGGIISPLLSNIYLDRMDKFVEQNLIPEFNRGAKRRTNPEYQMWNDRAYEARKRKDWQAEKEAGKQQRRLPAGDPNDPDYRRLRYIRYADDFLLGFAGPKAEAEEVKQRLGEFLNTQLKLELSKEKTLITHAETETARFLGYELAVMQCDTKYDRYGRRSINRAIELRVPVKVIEEQCSRYQRDGKPIHRMELTNDDDFTIMSLYQAEYRGYVQYYALAHNIAWIDRLHWVMETSLLKTLAHKHQTSVSKEAKRLKTTVDTDQGPRKCLQIKVERKGKAPLVARFGGISLTREIKATLIDRDIRPWKPKGTELIKRLLADECEICGSTEKVEVHHIRKLADLKVPGRKEKPPWMQIMAARKRTTLVLCYDCHKPITREQRRKQS